LSFNINDGSSNTAFSVKGSGEVMLPESGHLLLHLVLTDITMEPADPTVPSELEVLANDTMAFLKYNGEWYGQELTDQDKADLQDALGQITSTMAMGGGDMGMGDMGIDLTGVVTTTRGDDVEMMGMNMASFSTSIDITQLLVAALSSPMLGTLLGSSGADLGLGEMTPQDMQMMAMIFQPMLTGTTFDVQEWIGVDDMYLHKLALDINLHIDLSMFGGEATAPVTGAVHVDVSLDQVNEMFDIAAPESYKSIDELNMDAGGLDLGSLGSGLFGQ
jgi:hypothetical protein